MENKIYFDDNKQNPQSINNLNDINYYNTKNSQNIIISTNGITSEQTKMIEAFVMFQKFMNFSPELNNKIIINSKNFQSNGVKIALNNNNLNKNDTEVYNYYFNNKYYDNYTNSNKERKLNPIRRNKNKNFEKNNLNNLNNIETQEINNVINSINTKYRYNCHKKNLKEEQKLNYNNNINEDNDKYKYNNKLIDIDEIPIKSNKSLIEFGKGKLKDNINNNIPLTKNSNSFINIDDIVIKQSVTNFMELLDKNLKNEEQNYQSENKKALSTIKKNNEKFHQRRSINIIQNNKLNLDINNPSMEKILKQEKIKQYREKAKEIEKKVYKNSTSNIKTKNKINEKKYKYNFNSISNYEDNNNNEKKVMKINSYSNKLPIRIKSKIKNKWSNIEFDILEEKEDKIGDKNKALKQYQSKTISNSKGMVSLIKYKNLFMGKLNIDSNNINNKISDNKIIESKIKLNYRNKNINEREIYNKKLKLYNMELSKLNKEKEKIKKLKDDYDYFQSYLKNEKAIYDIQYKEEKINFNNYIVEEIKLINKEKKLIKEKQKYLNDLRVKSKMNNNLENTKGKNEIENMKIKISEMQKEVNLKEKNDKALIEKFKKHLFEANRNIEEMTNLINNFKPNNDFQNVCENNNFIKEDIHKNNLK